MRLETLAHLSAVRTALTILIAALLAGMLLSSQPRSTAQSFQPSLQSQMAVNTEHLRTNDKDLAAMLVRITDIDRREIEDREDMSRVKGFGAAGAIGIALINIMPIVLGWRKRESA